MSSQRGPLICFEGCDKSGKTTLASEFAKYLQEKETPVRIHHFPNRENPVGKILNSYLKNEIDFSDEQVHQLFTMDRRSTMQRYCIPDSTTVILDRYVFSGCVYTAAKGQLTIEWCLQQEQYLPKPDLIFFITNRIKNLCKIKTFGEERFENIEFQTKVYELYEQMFKNENNVYTIDTECSAIADSMSEIIQIYNQKISPFQFSDYYYF